LAWVNSKIREKYLVVKEKWPRVLTPSAAVWYRRGSVPQSLRITVSQFRTAPVSASACWWYWGSTEEASALA